MSESEARILFRVIGSVLLLGIVMWLVFKAMVWREERGYQIRRSALDREWCWHYRYFGKGWEDLAADIEKAGAPVHPWIQAKITEAELGRQEYCGQVGMALDVRRAQVER